MAKTAESIIEDLLKVYRGPDYVVIRWYWRERPGLKGVTKSTPVASARKVLERLRERNPHIHYYLDEAVEEDKQ